jgi:hypothetical protein
LREVKKENTNLKDNMLFQKFRKYFDEFYYALDKKYIDASKHTEEEKKWTLDNYKCQYFEKLERYFHSSKILS